MLRTAFYFHPSQCSFYYYHRLSYYMRVVYMSEMHVCKLSFPDFFVLFFLWHLCVCGGGEGHARVYVCVCAFLLLCVFLIVFCSLFLLCLFVYLCFLFSLGFFVLCWFCFSVCMFTPEKTPDQKQIKAKWKKNPLLTRKLPIISFVFPGTIRAP